jgi:hypothetical protein
MMVIPTQSHVTLTYGRTAANTLGQVLQVLAWVLLVSLAIWRTILWRRRRRLAGPGAAVIPVHDFAGQYGDRGGQGDYYEPAPPRDDVWPDYEGGGVIDVADSPSVDTHGGIDDEGEELARET